MGRGGGGGGGRGGGETEREPEVVDSESVDLAPISASSLQDPRRRPGRPLGPSAPQLLGSGRISPNIQET